MDSDLCQSVIRGVERLAAWGDLLNVINVFPVADGDTGTNLIVSLTPLLALNNNKDAVFRKLLFSARGNSGNIAAAFFSGFLTADTIEMLPAAANLGNERARRSVADPKPGTMLSVFESLAEGLNRSDIHQLNCNDLIEQIKKTVQDTRSALPILQIANVVDSGALGMFIFLDTFFHHLFGKSNFTSIPAAFSGMLQISPDFNGQIQDSLCINMTVRIHRNCSDAIEKISGYGQHAVISEADNLLKAHIHTNNASDLRKKIESSGAVVQWSEEKIDTSADRVKHTGAVHIMTDAAGSVTRKDSERWGMTLLNSYISIGDLSLPETYLTPSDVYEPMKNGVKAVTSQASVFERYQQYQRVVGLFRHVVYLCVGSVFTGNYHTAMEWKQNYDPENRMTIIDTQAASGKLGVIALATARFASQADDPESVVRFAQSAVSQSQEYVFIDKLKYLAAGGRLSKTSAFVGDIFAMKPVISPTAAGAKKVGMVRNQADQLAFAVNKLRQYCPKDSKPFIMAEYSDNQVWVEEIVYQKIKDCCPSAEIIIQPLSLTSGVHMGPGTWAIAFLPETGISYA